MAREAARKASAVYYSPNDFLAVWARAYPTPADYAEKQRVLALLAKEKAKKAAVRKKLRDKEKKRAALLNPASLAAAFLPPSHRLRAEIAALAAEAAKAYAEKKRRANQRRADNAAAAEFLRCLP